MTFPPNEFVALSEVKSIVPREATSKASATKKPTKLKKKVTGSVKTTWTVESSVHKPMSAYNYFFRDERHSIVEWKGEGLPPPVVPK